MDEVGDLGGVLEGGERGRCGGLVWRRGGWGWRARLGGRRGGRDDGRMGAWYWVLGNVYKNGDLRCGYPVCLISA